MDEAKKQEIAERAERAALAYNAFKATIRPPLIAASCECDDGGACAGGSHPTCKCPSGGAMAE